MSNIYDDIKREKEMKNATRSLLIKIIDRMSLSEQLRLIGRLEIEGYK